MPNLRRLIVVGVITLLVGIVVMFPARVAYHWFAPPGAGVSGISGTVGRGNAADVVVAGVYLRNVEWRFKPLGIFTGKLRYGLSASPGIGTLSSNVAVSLGGDLIVDSLQGDMALGLFSAPLGMPGLQGRARLQFDKARLSGGVLIEADGRIDTSGISLPLVTQGGIGGYSVEFTTGDNEVLASIEDTDGIVDIAGSLRLGRDRRYVFQGLVAPKDSTPAQLAQQMQLFLGSPDERGRYEMRFEGQL